MSGAHPERIEIRVDSLAEPISHYTHATVFGDLVFVSGCTGTDRSGAVVSDDVSLQAAQALQNIADILAHAGASLADVLKVTVFLADVNDRARINAARQQAFGDVRPASTLVEVSGFARPGVKVEIEAIAARPRSYSPRRRGDQDMNMHTDDHRTTIEEAAR